jgi:hypothetical protein
VRKWSLTLATAAVTAAVLLGAGFLISRAGSDGGAEAASNTTPAAAAAAQAPKRARELGPEGVPVAAGKPLGPASAPAPGHSRGGIPCGSGEQLAYHVHAHLTLFINGKSRKVPLGVGIGAPVRTTKSAGGPFASGGSCFSFLHTHAADGVIHIEAPARVTFKLGQFFDVWQQRLDRRHLGQASGRVVAYVNGKRWRGDPRAIPLRKHAQIQLQVGQPFVAPVSIDFPAGL